MYQWSHISLPGSTSVFWSVQPTITCLFSTSKCIQWLVPHKCNPYYWFRRVAMVTEGTVPTWPSLLESEFSSVEVFLVPGTNWGFSEGRGRGRGRGRGGGGGGTCQFHSFHWPLITCCWVGHGVGPLLITPSPRPPEETFISLLDPQAAYLGGPYGLSHKQ